MKFPRARENISLPSSSSQYVGVYPRSCMTVWLLLGLVSSGMGLLASWDITFICAQLYRPFVTPWTVAYQAPLTMEFSRQEYWSGLPFPTPGDRCPDL